MCPGSLAACGLLVKRIIPFNTYKHPFMQLFSFCIVLVGSAYFGGLLYVFISRCAGSIYVCANLLYRVGYNNRVFMRGYGRTVMQFIGACLMVVSLFVFFFSSEHFMNMYVYRHFKGTGMDHFNTYDCCRGRAY